MKFIFFKVFLNKSQAKKIQAKNNKRNFYTCLDMGSCASFQKNSNTYNKNKNKKSHSLPSSFTSSIFSYGCNKETKRRHQQFITESDFLIGVNKHIETNVALSAFRIFDKNNKRYLSVSDARSAYEYLRKLTDF